MPTCAPLRVDVSLDSLKKQFKVPDRFKSNTTTTGHLGRLMTKSYSYYWRRPYYYWSTLDDDINRRMYMFKSVLDSIPKNRSDYVEDLEIPDITLNPYVWTEPEDYYYNLRRNSYLTDALAELDKGTISTDSSLPLSRAMTDSEIDYGFYKRYRNYSDKWDYLREAYRAFPTGYIDSLNRYIDTSTNVDEALLNSELRYAAELAANRRRYNEERARRLRRQFNEECYNLYSPGDPSLLELQDAIQKLDKKALEADLDCIGPRLRSRLALNRLRRTLYYM